MHRIHNIETTLEVFDSSLTRTRIERSQLRMAELVDCNTERLKATRCQLNNSAFNDVSLIGAEFKDCDFTGATIDGVLIDDILEIYRGFKAGLTSSGE